MARPLRLEFAGTLYHVTSRGDRREDIFLDDEDRENWLDVLANVCSRFNWVVHAYCQGRYNPLEQTRHQLLLGDESFVERNRQKNQNEDLRELSKAHRRSLALSLDEYRNRVNSRDEAMAKAYLSGAYTMAEIGRHFGVHYMTVSRAVRKFEESIAME